MTLLFYKHLACLNPRGEEKATEQTSPELTVHLLTVHLNPIGAQMGFLIQFNFTSICSSEAKFNYIDQLPKRLQGQTNKMTCSQQSLKRVNQDILFVLSMADHSESLTKGPR